MDLFAYLYFPFHFTLHVPTVTEMGWKNVHTVLHYKRFGYTDSFFCMNKNLFFRGSRGNNPFTTDLRDLMHTLNEWIFWCMFV